MYINHKTLQNFPTLQDFPTYH